MNYEFFTLFSCSIHTLAAKVNALAVRARYRSSPLAAIVSRSSHLVTSKATDRFGEDIPAPRASRLIRRVQVPHHDHDRSFAELLRKESRGSRSERRGAINRGVDPHQHPSALVCLLSVGAIGLNSCSVGRPRHRRSS